MRSSSRTQERERRTHILTWSRSVRERFAGGWSGVEGEVESLDAQRAGARAQLLSAEEGAQGVCGWRTGLGSRGGERERGRVDRQ